MRALAAAPLDDVLALWSGLGYYSRARNLHRCAQEVVADHGGRFPTDAATLATLPGVGRSTAAAIAVFAAGERAAILDGNVKRVLTRALGFGADLALPANERELWTRAEALLPKAGIEAYTQGLMDLGATLCRARAPRCDDCPLRGDCVARAEGRPEAYPVKTRRSQRGARSNALLWVVHGERLWLTQRAPRGVWAGLWTLPLFGDVPAIEELATDWPGRTEPLPAFTHALTHFDWQLEPVRYTLPARTKSHAIERALGEGRWFTRDEALALGLPAPIRKLLQSY